MDDFLSRLSSAAEGIRNAEEKRKALAEFLKEKSEGFSAADIMEKNLIHMVRPQYLSGKKILAVDGGLSQHSYQGIELALLRAVAVLFRYGNGKAEVAYHPSAEPRPEIILLSDPSEESGLDIGNERQQLEIGTAISAAKKFAPDLLLMDGMIVPHINDIPKAESESRERFARTLKSFNDLYGACLHFLLAGCVEDSRGKRLCGILSKNGALGKEQKELLSASSDTSILHYLLGCGERTCAFRFSGDNLTNILGEEGKNIYSFYMRTAKFDRPLRVDFYCKTPEQTAASADKISSLILSSCCHDSYGFPAPLTEADFRARLSESDAEKLRDRIADKVGMLPSLMKLRRELRPF